MIDKDDILMSSPNKYEMGMKKLMWENSEMRDCKVKLVEEDGIWYLLKDRS